MHDALKEHADWKGKTSGWVLRPGALALLSGTAAAPVGDQADAGGAPAGGVQATPATARAAPAAAGLERFFTKVRLESVHLNPCCLAIRQYAECPRLFSALAEVSQPRHDTTSCVLCLRQEARIHAQPQGAAGTPAVPSALRPDAPPSELRAPDRLVVSTAAGMSAAFCNPAAAEPIPALSVPRSVSGTSDPFWRCLLQHLEAAEGGHPAAAAPTLAQAGEQPGQPGQEEPTGGLSFEAAFEPAALAHLAAGMPASILTALVTGAAAPDTSAAARTAYLRCLARAAATLAAAEAEAAGDNLSASQQVWAPRGAPAAASLPELCLEPQLLACLAAAAEAGRGACAASAEAHAARAAAAVASALAGSEACRAALQAGSSGSEAWAQLEALAASVEISAAAMEA